MKLNRNQLKQLWFNMDYSNVKESKSITITMDKYPARKGYGTVQITSEGPNGFNQFTTLQENPMQYVLDSKEYKSNEYELIIK